MRILYYYKDFPTPMYQWQHVHIVDELRHHNCFVEIFDPLTYRSFDEANQKLVQRCKKYQYDLFMTPHNEEVLYISTLKDIKALGIPTLLICFDNLLVPYVHLKIAPEFNLVWLTSKETKWIFDKKKCNSIFMPYAANPYIQRKEQQEVLGVGFVGTPYGSRSNIINALTNNGIETYVYFQSKKDKVRTGYNVNVKTLSNYMRYWPGRKVVAGALKNKWQKNGKLKDNNNLHFVNPCKPENLYIEYSKYALDLSSTAARNTGVLKKPLNIVNLRCFEIPMAGGIEFCRYSEELAEYFEDEKEIVFYDGYEDMIQKAKFYVKLENSPLREKIRINARKRAEQEHSWWTRFVKIFKILGVNFENDM